MPRLEVCEMVGMGVPARPEPVEIGGGQGTVHSVFLLSLRCARGGGARTHWACEVEAVILKELPCKDVKKLRSSIRPI